MMPISRKAFGYLQAFQAIEGSQVVAICDQDTTLAQRVGQQFHIDQVYTHYEQLLADKAVQIVIVATPGQLHGQHAIQAQSLDINTNKGYNHR
jgi:predicted dehydrogenase